MDKCGIIHDHTTDTFHAGNPFLRVSTHMPWSFFGDDSKASHSAARRSTTVVTRHSCHFRLLFADVSRKLMLSAVITSGHQ
eukprot:3512348-Alexandrium_andersonii.AAC.1